MRPYPDKKTKNDDRILEKITKRDTTGPRFIRVEAVSAPKRSGTLTKGVPSGS